MLKGVIRDQPARRMAMFVILVVAMLMLFAGMTFLNGLLMQRPFWFLIYWAACAWMTFAAILFALYDLLALRHRVRREKADLKQRIFSNDDKSTKH